MRGWEAVKQAVKIPPWCTPCSRLGSSGASRLTAARLKRPSPTAPFPQRGAGETASLRSRGCVDRGWDSAEHKAWSFTFHPMLNLPGKTQEESKVVQMRASVIARRELKTASEREERKSKRFGGREKAAQKKGKEKAGQQDCWRFWKNWKFFFLCSLLAARSHPSSRLRWRLSGRTVLTEQLADCVHADLTDDRKMFFFKKSSDGGVRRKKRGVFWTADRSWQPPPLLHLKVWSFNG